MPNVRFTTQALESTTLAQRDALVRLCRQNETDTIRGIDVQLGGFDLPDGYLAFRCDYINGQPMYGGISPEGEVST
jgi:hypothetical protein